MGARSLKRKATDRCSRSRVHDERFHVLKSIQREVASAFADGAPPVRVRIGLHTGDALQEADQFFGTTVHYAARVASHALAGEILVSSVVRDLVAGGPDIEFLEEREVQLKGLDGRHRLFAVELA